MSKVPKPVVDVWHCEFFFFFFLRAYVHICCTPLFQILDPPMHALKHSIMPPVVLSINPSQLSSSTSTLAPCTRVQKNPLLISAFHFSFSFRLFSFIFHPFPVTLLQLTSQRSVTLVLMSASYIIMFVTILLIIEANSAVLRNSFNDIHDSFNDIHE